MKKINILSFKHNSNLHRIWKDCILLREDSQKWVLISEKNTLIFDYGLNPRKWLSKELAIIYLYKDNWFNIIAMIKKNKINYYCNIASPSIIDIDGIKNIDYDLDLKIDEYFNYSILDEDEFNINAINYNYPKKLVNIVNNSLDYLIENRYRFCNNKIVIKDYKKYQKLLHKN